MNQISSVAALAQVIQLAVAPVFLLAGIAGLLNVLSMRLSRITDRARVIERRIPHARERGQQDFLQAEVALLWSRIRHINWAMRLSVSGALTVCLVIVTLFVGAFSPFNFAALVAVLFVAAMLLVISGLVLLLREVGIATRRMRQGIEIALEEAARGPQDPG